MNQYEETIECDFVCTITFDNKPEPQEFEFDNLEELHFHLSYILTTSQFSNISIIKKDKGRYRL